MGKGYNNYMCKKPFHPGSKANIKRTWMAEQQTESEKKKQDDLKVQYEKEQELYNNRALLSTESKDKLELNFMYEAPPGAKRERQKEDDEPEYKFEWQRKYNAPREDYAKGNADIRDQPFGIPVRNVRCIKCHKWGHINTDRECPLYSQASTSSMPTTSMDPLELMRQMREDGYNLKQNVLGHHLNPQQTNQQLIASDESEPELKFLKTLSSKQRQKLYKKLTKLSKKQKEKARNSKKRSSKNQKQKHSNSPSGSESEKEVKYENKTYEKDSPEFESNNPSSDSNCTQSKPNKSISENKRKSTGDKILATTSKKSKQDKHEKNVVAEQQKSNASSCEDSDSSAKKDMAVLKQTRCRAEKSRKSSSTHKFISEPSAEIPTKPQKSKRKGEDFTYEESYTHSKVSLRLDEHCTPPHPDNFDHDFPQKDRREELQPDMFKYIGSVHDKFRCRHRHRRSPSVKHKYRQ